MVWPCTFYKKTSAVILILGLGISACGADKGPKYETKQINLGGKTITVEIADTEKKREHGLMFRENMPQNHGMLFIFDYEQPLNFWMKNTYIDLAIGYFDKDRTLVDIQEMKSTSVMTVDFPTYPSKKPAQYALEMNSGWFSANNVKLGSRFEMKETPKSRARN